MIRLMLDRYNDCEKAMLKQLFIEAKKSVVTQSDCNDDDCYQCPYKHVCEDFVATIRYLTEILEG
jgi:hypothetical protein|nr:MAG TPA: Cas system-associated protein [Bacteriophage sp.]